MPILQKTELFTKLQCQLILENHNRLGVRLGFCKADKLRIEITSKSGPS